MKIFHCGRCDQLVFFENTWCIKCGHALAYLPEQGVMGTFAWVSDPPRLVAAGSAARGYRWCANYGSGGVCNWAVAADDWSAYCRSCRLTRVIPNLSQPGTREAWCRLEAAKRRLVYSLIRLGLPLATRAEEPQRGLAFEFLADVPSWTPGVGPVLTGHENGVITINVAEADDAEREKRRLQMHEPYRTILGHFRHEIGHYYWDRLISNTGWIEEFRRLFGDERQDYHRALEQHYNQGAPGNWAWSFISAYASSHPWEDWAETWAHYLHVIDSLETADDCGLGLWPKRSDEPTLWPNIGVNGWQCLPFKQVIERWFSLTYVLNNLNRGMGLPDAYPFVLRTRAVEKLRFVHEVIGQSAPAARSPAVLPMLSNATFMSTAPFR
jgi:hypothetical protein